MARIEIKGGNQPVQLTLPESSTVLVFPRVLSKQEVPRFQHPSKEPVVGSGLVLAVIQDFKDFGPADIDENGNFTLLAKKLRQIRNHGVNCNQFLDQVDNLIGETRLRQEGFRMGSLPQTMNDVKKLFSELAEEIWTEPSRAVA